MFFFYIFIVLHQSSFCARLQQMCIFNEIFKHSPPTIFKHFVIACATFLFLISSISPYQCRRSSSGRRCTLERRVMAKSQPSCTAAATSDTDPQSAVTAVRDQRRSPPTLMNVPTQTHLSSRSYQVSFFSRTNASHMLHTRFTRFCSCADVPGV